MIRECLEELRHSPSMLADGWHARSDTVLGAAARRYTAELAQLHMAWLKTHEKK